MACDSIRGKKGVVCVYDEGLAHDIEMESYVLQYLDEAIQNGYIKVYYQPVVRTISGKVCSMEALARWIDPYKGFLSPGDFIPVLERNRLISLAAKLGISKNVIFTGFIRGQKLRDIYSVSDIFVMSSISEPFGLTALEAAHHGDCLILTKQSGVSEIIWSALKYDFWDERKLADEIVAISNNTALKETLVSNVTKEYRQITWNQVAKKCLRIYNNIKRKRK